MRKYESEFLNFSGCFLEQVLVAPGFSRHVLGKRVKAAEQELHVELFRAAQPFSAQEIQHCDIDFLQLRVRKR